MTFMKRALVLGGGGSRGSYEIGVWKAMRQLNLSYDIITGTSIGSINGALMVQNEYDKAYEFWSKITVDDVMASGINLDFDLEVLLSQKEKLKPFLKNYITNKGADISPLRKIMEEIFDETKLRNSKVDYGLVTLQIPSLKPLELTKNEIPDGKLTDYILASASCFPAFPMCKIDGKRYIDGGYYDNLPINLAIKMGATDIVAVDLFHKNETHPDLINTKPFIKYIVPSWDLGTILNFEHNGLLHNMQLGYLDTMKQFSKLDGYRYAFKKTTLPWKIDQIGERYLDLIRTFEAQIPLRNNGTFLKLLEEDCLTKRLKKHTYQQCLTKKDYVIRGCELGMEALRMDPLDVYHLKKVSKEMLEHYHRKERYQYTDLLTKIKNVKTLSKKYEIVKTMDHEYLVGYLYHRLLEHKKELNDLYLYAAVIPKEVAAALYLVAVHDVLKYKE